ncbi:hypothetical protein F6R98_01810 [Candidatus Methylospira mobilis]|uniref:Iminophenyl-pyruvate dimer synthase domain-containing protein n=1 Tax=Candidatus Methylospira mobilis TaxID=1808979 RepID=A0A5Q0BC42_9GAMM|nr:ferritin-like protein [Candidatus Methylospira mobilis]QFY41513.1 hypothetical protein F6R98_01810 [Candidatus Methylospira mobilis]WNV05252.1 ferritin-like protein [Candidatus Methylospira mobilis]
MVSRRNILKMGLAGVGQSLFAPVSGAAATPGAIHNDHGQDIAWLRNALQTAIQLEFATIPLYLCAAWSITDAADPARNTLLDIVQEEMLHMGLACNMLSAIGGRPDICSPGSVPVYPGALPGGIHPGMTAALRRLTPSTLDVFMAIENPEAPVVSDTAYSEQSSTIGAFYSQIWQVFKRLRPRFASTGQIEGSLGLFTMHSLDDVDSAINEIIHQGSGTPSSPMNAKGNGLAHYYRFAELHHGRRLVQKPGEAWGFHGDVVAFPSVYPMADIPSGGYLRQDLPAPVWESIHAFDRCYSAMLKSLDAALTRGSQRNLADSVMQMREMKDIGVALMKQPISANNPGCGNYGPCFRFIG